ncbi:MAG: transcription-repair coupling factor [Defluviitaleaceae bacterium]|nr:transcription-repair coupling factor [Defluviitaleaceae bacterium]
MFFKPNSEFTNIKNIINENKSPALITHLTDTAKSHVISLLYKETDRASLVITHSELRAKQIYEELSFFSDENVNIYPSKDILFFNSDVKSKGITIERFYILESILNTNNSKNKQKLIVLSAEALLDKILPPNIFSEFRINIKNGEELKIEDIVKKLRMLGYRKRDQIEAEGHFAVRGGILDIFTWVCEDIESKAYRIEFFGDEIDSIRTIDINTGRSVSKVEDITIFPVTELLYTEEIFESSIKKIESEYNKNLKLLQGEEEKRRLKEYVGETLEILKQNKTADDIDKFFAYFYNGSSLLDYINKDWIIYIDEPNKVKHHVGAVYAEFEESNKTKLLNGYILKTQQDILFSYDYLLDEINKFTCILLMTFPATPIDFKVNSISKIPTREISFPKNSIEHLREEILFQNENKKSIIIFSTKGEYLSKELTNIGVPILYTENDYTKYLGDKEINIIYPGNIGRGFEYISENIMFISEKEVFIKNKKRTSRRKSAKIENFTDLKLGDYIVHDNHGIGIYDGMETIIVDNVSRDYLKLSYKDNGKLYVPVTQLDRIQKYIGNNVPLNKLGTNSWEKTKSKVKEAVQEFAKELAKLYAKRNEKVGFEFSEDSIWQKEFEDSFPFEETEDQINAIEDVKKDMESKKVMDRLICGDVGFGKTEVAIRAAFKAVQDGKQVAFLVPTTILAQQHYKTFIDRMKDFPVSIEVLSRFRSKKEQAETINRISNGFCDIVIGTHRLLSKDIIFKNLGLIIVDEEQRFGVIHKEKLKQMTVNVDSLTLTATPIPRTMHMSLSGIRDISLLQEPPTLRKNIQTFVLEYEKEFIKTAITRELARAGQVYYLYNNVKNISNISQVIKSIVPDAKVTFAHGQMSEKELENVMIDFINAEIDVLVCTTIIETGLDIPNVNTIIIQDADRMGLAQLYQLRGRVGRSDRVAYSYLLYKKDKVLSEVATNRLQTIRDFTEFGSGFKVALKDLEIRGVGSLLGAEQSGHMGSVGYEMYTRMLEDAVKEIEGKEIEQQIEISVDIKISAYISPNYITNEEQRLFIYKKISHIKSEIDFYDIWEEIEDKYGDIPKSVENLLNIALLKGLAGKVGVKEINQKGNNVVVLFSANAKIDMEKMKDCITKNNNILFTVSEFPYLTYKTMKGVKIEDIVNLRNIISDVELKI